MCPVVTFAGFVFASEAVSDPTAAGTTSLSGYQHRLPQLHTRMLRLCSDSIMSDTAVANRLGVATILSEFMDGVSAVISHIKVRAPRV